MRGAALGEAVAEQFGDLVRVVCGCRGTQPGKAGVAHGGSKHGEIDAAERQELGPKRAVLRVGVLEVLVERLPRAARRGAATRAPPRWPSCRRAAPSGRTRVSTRKYREPADLRGRRSAAPRLPPSGTCRTLQRLLPVARRWTPRPRVARWRRPRRRPAPPGYPGRAVVIGSGCSSSASAAFPSQSSSTTVIGSPIGLRAGTCHGATGGSCS